MNLTNELKALMNETNEAKKSPTADKIDSFLMEGEEAEAVKFAQKHLDSKKIKKTVTIKNISAVKLMIARFEKGIIPDLSKSLSKSLNEAKSKWAGLDQEELVTVLEDTDKFISKLVGNANDKKMDDKAKLSKLVKLIGELDTAMK